MGKRKWKHHFEVGQEALESGDLTTAEESLRQALELSVGIKDKDCSYGDTALLLGQVFRRKESYHESDDLSRKAFTYYQSALGLTDPRTVQAHLAIVLSIPTESHADLDVRKATFELAKAQFGEKSWQAVRTAALAMACFSYQEREKVISLALTACTAVLNEDRVHLALWPPVAQEFAEALLAQDLKDHVAKFLGFQLRFYEEKLGAKSKEATLTRLRLGELFLALGDPKKAETAFGSAVESIRLKMGPKSPEMRRAQVALARALAQQKKLNEAAPYLTDALSYLGSHQVEERSEVLLALLEQKCLVAGADSERGALWQELEAVWERAEDDAVKERILGGLLAAQARLQQAWELTAADRFLHAVLARVRQWRGPNHIDVAVVLSELALCSIGLGDSARAQGFLDQSLAIDEGVDTLTRAAFGYAKLGNSERAQEYADRAIVVARAYPAGPDQGRRQAKLAEALLGAGNLTRADEFAKLAERQVPTSEQPWVLCLLGRVQVCLGQYSQAFRTYRENAPRLTDPYERALGFVQLAWLQARTGDFEGAKASLAEVERLSEVRPDHPVVYMAKAVASQIAFYSGMVHEGLELRNSVQSYLKAGRHTPSRALDILVLLEPFGQEESQLELEVGTEVLAATDFPERNLSVFPVVDAACLGLRHVARALFFSEQLELAKERLSQYEARFLSFYRPDNPLASSIHLTRATLATTDGERLVSLEAALPGLRTLSPQHVSLFPTLLKLTEVCVRIGDINRALTHCRAALEARRTPRLVEWEALLSCGELPEIGLEPVETRAELSLGSVDPSSSGAERRSIGESGEAEVAPAPSSPIFIGEDHPTVLDDIPTLGAEGSVVIASGGGQNLAEMQAARILSERAEAPTPQEAQEFLNEVKARFGNEVEPNLEARLLIALLFPDGSKESTAYWAQALDLISESAGIDLLTVENRARDANAWSLVVQTLKERLRRESDRFGENSVETLETQTRLARALESKGEVREAYPRFTLVAEVLRSWYGARSRRLLEPLAELIRVAEKLDDVQAAFEHQLERHRLLEAADGDAEELLQSRISLLPLRGRLGQVDELLAEAHNCERELLGFRSGAVSEFVRVLLVAARRVDQLHWRCDVAATLLELAVRVLPENEVSLGCRVKIALAEALYRKDYRSQAAKLRNEALEKASALDADARAEMLHVAAQSCMRTQEVELARSVAERILDERIAQAGRKDIWAGRALLILAEADLRVYRLEGTETAIGMSAPSLEGTRYWAKAQSLQLQALFFLNRFDEVDSVLQSLSGDRKFEAELHLSVWRGSGGETVQRFLQPTDIPFGERWARLESLPLNHAVQILEFFARSGQVKLLTDGYERIKPRLDAVVSTDIRDTRIKILVACIDFWKGDWERANGTLFRTLEMVPDGIVTFPEGLVANVIREALLSCFLLEGRPTAALGLAKQGVAESAELLGEEDVRAQVFRVRLAECARALGQVDDALVLLDEILEPLQETLGDTHVLLRDVYRGLAQAFLDQDDFESAQMSAEEALRIDTTCRGYSMQVLQDLELLADVAARFDLEEANSVLEQALRLVPDILPPNHPYAFVLAEKREALEMRLTQDEPLPEAELQAPQEFEDRETTNTEVDSAESLFAGATEIADEASSSEELVAVVEEEVIAVATDSAEALFDLIDEEAYEFELNEDELAELRESGELGEREPSPEKSEEESPESGLEDWVALDEVVESQEIEVPSQENSSESALSQESEAVEEKLNSSVSVHHVFDAEPSDQAQSLHTEFRDEPLHRSPEKDSREDVTSLFDDLVVIEGEFDDDDEDDVALESADLEVVEGEFDDDIDSAESVEVIEAEEEPPVAEEIVEVAEAEVEPPAAEEVVEVAEAEVESPVAEEVVEPSRETSQSARGESSPSLYRSQFKTTELKPVVGGASVEMNLDFPEVPMRLPEISGPLTTQSSEESSSKDSYPGPTDGPIEEVLSDEEPAVDGDSSLENSVEQILEISDPESFLLPLAPLFFLPVPWKEATEAPFEPQFEEIYLRFQSAFSANDDWRSVVEEAVSLVRSDLSPASGYFLFLIGAQLEKSGYLHVADVCLATSLELLDTGAPLGAACHLAGRVAGRRGELRRALDYFDRAAELADEPELAVLKVDAAECQLGLGRPEEALLGFEEVFDYLAENAPKVQVLAVQAKMAQVHLLIGDSDTSLALAEETLRGLSPKNVGTYRVLGRILLSRAYARLGRHELALELAETAWEGAEGWSAKRKDGRRIAISNLVDIYGVVGRVKDAEKLILESGLTDWGLAEAELLLRAGQIACAIGNLENARRYCRLGRAFLGRFQSPALWQSCFLELESDICLKEGEYSKAEALCQRALATFEREATGPVDRSRHLVRAAKIAGAQGAIDKALELVEQAHALRDLHLGSEHPHTSSVEGLSAVFSP